jgi:hypothetical protein
MRALLQSHPVAAYYTESSADVASIISRLKSVQSSIAGMQPCASSSQMIAQFRRVLVVIKSSFSISLGEMKTRDVGFTRTSREKPRWCRLVCGLIERVTQEESS